LFWWSSPETVQQCDAGLELNEKLLMLAGASSDVNHTHCKPWLSNLTINLGSSKH
jgi:hypothetical protein